VTQWQRHNQRRVLRSTPPRPLARALQTHEKAMGPMHKQSEDALSLGQMMCRTRRPNAAVDVANAAGGEGGALRLARWLGGSTRRTRTYR